MLNNVLLPKTKGFSVCLETLRTSLDAGLVHNSTLVNTISMCQEAKV